nr:hypothetical protein [uncultured Rhodoferax sp.]
MVNTVPERGGQWDICRSRTRRKNKKENKQLWQNFFIHLQGNDPPESVKKWL